MRGLLCCDQGVAGALCLFSVVVAARGRLVKGYAIARIGLAGYAFVVYGFVVVLLSPALRVAGFVVGCGVLCYAAFRVLVVGGARHGGRGVVMSGPFPDGAWCVVLCRVALRCVVLCCVVWSGGGVTPLMVGRAALGCCVL